MRQGPSAGPGGWGHHPPAGPERVPSLAAASARLVAAAEEVAAAAARERVVGAGERELVGALDGVDHALRLGQAAMLGITREAITRGLPGQSGHTVHDWMAMHAHRSTRADRSAVCAVAAALDHADPPTRTVHRTLEADLEDGTLGLGPARRLFATMTRLRPHVDDDTYAEDLATLTPLAVSGSEKDLRTATDHLLACALPDEDREKASADKYEGRGVFESTIHSAQLETDLYELRVVCDTQGQAILQALFASALTRPVPDPDTGARDPRSAAQRRYDALITMITRGTAAPAGSPGTARATVLVTMTMDQFTQQATARPADPGGSDDDPADDPDGAGPGSRPVLTGTGAALTPGEARRIACDAGIVPIVLGGDSRPLDVGRTRRLATPAQVHALRVRDGGCTHPGCTIPAGWCDAHHLTPWSAGGGTDLANLVLLCQAHHTLIHQPGSRFTPARRGIPQEDDPDHPATR